MSESLFWANDVSKLKHFGIAKRIEDLIEKGTSDVVYCTRFNPKERPRTGWIELKKLKRWPRRGNVMLPHFTPFQSNFLVRWGKAGAGAYLLAQVEDWYLLWGWEDVESIQKGLSRGAMEVRALVIGQGSFPLNLVLREISRWPD